MSSCSICSSSRGAAAFLAVPKAIEVHARLGWEGARALARRARERLAAAGYAPMPAAPAPCMFAVELPERDADEVQRRLRGEHRVEVVVSAWEGRSLLRVSIAPTTSRRTSTASSPRRRQSSDRRF